MSKRKHKQSFDEYESEQADSKLTPLELATDRYLAAPVGTEERLRLSGLLVDAMRGRRLTEGEKHG